VALSSSILKGLIISGMDDLVAEKKLLEDDDPKKNVTQDESYTIYVDSIKNHIIDNLLLIGSYAGVLTSNGNPDPLVGPYSFAVESIPGLTISSMKVNSSEGFAGFKLKLLTALKTVLFKSTSTDSVLAVSTPMLLPIPEVSITQEGSDQRDDAVKQLCDEIISSIGKTIVTTVGGPGVTSKSVGPFTGSALG